jgi:hypothetical protein
MAVNIPNILCFILIFLVFIYIVTIFLSFYIIYMRIMEFIQYLRKAFDDIFKFISDGIIELFNILYEDISNLIDDIF